MSGSYTLVFETAHGATRRCTCCAALQVLFGNALFGLQPDDFVPLRDAVAAADGGTVARGPWPSDRVVLLLGETGVGFVFARAEIAELHRLLEATQLLLDLGSDHRVPPP